MKELIKTFKQKIRQNYIVSKIIIVIQNPKYSIIFFVLRAFILSVLFRMFFFENYKIPSTSMNPTLLVGDRLIASKYYYGYSKYSFFPFNLPFKGKFLSFRKPKTGDIVIFAGLKEKGEKDFYIKRVIGLPGDRILIINGKIIINKQEIDQQFIKLLSPLQDENENYFSTSVTEEFLDNKEYYTLIGNKNSAVNNTGYFEVPENHYFLMGDNRDNSNDSRLDIGFVHSDRIIAKAEIIYFSSKESPLMFWKLKDSIRKNRILKKIV